MPAYNTQTPPPSLATNDVAPIALFNNEAVVAGEKSQQFARSRQLGSDPTTFSFNWAAAPTATAVVQGAMTDQDAAYQTLYTSTNKQQDLYTDTGRWPFYRVVVSAYVAGGNLTAQAY